MYLFCLSVSRHEGLVCIIYPWNCDEPCWALVKSPARADHGALRPGWAGVELFVWSWRPAGSQPTELETYVGEAQGKRVWRPWGLVMPTVGAAGREKKEGRDLSPLVWG